MSDNNEEPLTSQANRRLRRANILKELPDLIVEGSSDCDQFVEEIAETTGLQVGKKAKVKSDEKEVVPKAKELPLVDPVETRVSVIADVMNGQGLVTATLLRDVVAAGPHGTYEAKEDGGPAILFSGLKGPSEIKEDGDVWDQQVKQGWLDFGFGLKHGMTIPEAALTQSSQEDQSDSQLMCQMNADISKHANHQTAYNLHIHIMKNLLILEFCTKWAVLIIGEGASKRHNEYYARVYQAQSKVAESLDNEFQTWDELQVHPDHRTALKEFTADQRSIITSRNRYMLLYKKFGIILLMVTAFDGTSMRNSDTTKNYTKVLTRLLEIRNESANADDLEERDDSNWAVVALVLQEVDRDLYTRLVSFDKTYEANLKYIQENGEKTDD
ncbi:hypothetical protein K438DRAFT_1985475 [Mycena galopus ATCC 62051]|nr:hypothetical protein K438DRAFT_1985475 [Mycena galopus ATCC 62051]